jgi:hypothetical protein
MNEGLYVSFEKQCLHVVGALSEQGRRDSRDTQGGGPGRDFLKLGLSVLTKLSVTVTVAVTFDRDCGRVRKKVRWMFRARVLRIIVCMYACMYELMHVCMYVCMHACMCMCVCG